MKKEFPKTVSYNRFVELQKSALLPLCYLSQLFRGEKTGIYFVDSTPIEGFDPAAVDKILGLREKGLRSCVLLPVGYRNADSDWLVNLKKVRKSTEDLVTVIE